jgi:hypothetical protein
MTPKVGTGPERGARIATLIVSSLGPQAARAAATIAKTAATLSVRMKALLRNRFSTETD